jgi:hypothetical protein
MTSDEMMQRFYWAARAAADTAAGRKGAASPAQFAMFARNPALFGPIGALLVLDDEVVNTFLILHAAPLIDLLRRRTRRDLHPVGAGGGGGLRGRIDWGATLRHRGGSPATSGDLVCRVPHYDFDQRENQFLIYLLAHLRRCDDMAGRLFAGLFADTPSTSLGAERLARTGRLAELWNRLPPLGEIDLPPRLGSAHTAAVRTAAVRHRGYQHLLEAYYRVRPLTLEPDAIVWRDTLAVSRLKTKDAWNALYDMEGSSKPLAE